jgi:hypothetical protein
MTLTKNQRSILETLKNGPIQAMIWNTTVEGATKLESKGLTKVTGTGELQDNRWPIFQAEITRAGLKALEPTTRGRPRTYNDDAERQATYRERKTEELETLRDEVTELRKIKEIAERVIKARFGFSSNTIGDLETIEELFKTEYEYDPETQRTRKKQK